MISWGAIILGPSFLGESLKRVLAYTLLVASVLDPFMRPIRVVMATFRGIDFHVGADSDHESSLPVVIVPPQRDSLF